MVKIFIHGGGGDGAGTGAGAGCGGGGVGGSGRGEEGLRKSFFCFCFSLPSPPSSSSFSSSGHPDITNVADIRNWDSSVVERRTRDRKISGSNPVNSGKRFFFSPVSTFCADT